MVEKTVHLQYFALLQEERGVDKETIQTSAHTLEELYHTLKTQYGFQLNIDVLRVSQNCTFVDWQTAIQDGDEIVFIPPVAGG